MSTTETTPLPTRENITFEKLGFRPWTVDILENTLENHPEEDYLDNTPPLRSIMPDAVFAPPTDSQNNTSTPILIGGFLNTAQLYASCSTNYTPKVRFNETGMRMQEQEELTLLKERIKKLECILKSERALRTLLEEKLSHTMTP